MKVDSDSKSVMSTPTVAATASLNDAVRPMVPFLFGLCAFVFSFALLLPYGIAPFLLQHGPIVATPSDHPTYPGHIASSPTGANWQDITRGGLILSFPLSAATTIVSALLLLVGSVVQRGTRVCLYIGWLAIIAWWARAWAGRYIVGLVLLLIVALFHKWIFRATVAKVTLRERSAFLRILRATTIAWAGVAVAGSLAFGGRCVLEYLTTLRDLACESRSWTHAVYEAYFDYTPSFSRVTVADPRLPVVASANLEVSAQAWLTALRTTAYSNYIVIGLLALPLLATTGLYAVTRSQIVRLWGCHTKRWTLGIQTVGVFLIIWACWTLAYPLLKAATLQSVCRFSACSCNDLSENCGYIRNYCICRRLAQTRSTRTDARCQPELVALTRNNPHPTLRYWAMRAYALNRLEGWERIVTERLTDNVPQIQANALGLLPPGNVEGQQFAAAVAADSKAHPYVRVAATEYLRKEK